MCCGKRVGSKSILCPSYKHWIYHHCCWIRGSLSDAVNFICPICQDGTHLDSQPQPPVTLAGNNLEVVDKFCYLDDMLVTAMTVKSLPPSQGWNEAGKGSESWNISCALRLSLLNSRAFLFKSCVQTVLLYDSETWPAKSEDIQRLDRTESARMCGSSVGDLLVLNLDPNEASPQSQNWCPMAGFAGLYTYPWRMNRTGWEVDSHGASLRGQHPK